MSLWRLRSSRATLVAGNFSTDLGVSIPGAGWLVTGYALGVAIGAPFMALATAKLPRKAALVVDAMSVLTRVLAKELQRHAEHGG